MKWHLIPFFFITQLSCMSAEEASDQGTRAELLSSIDHLVYATPDLDQGVAEIEKLLGIKASPGGQHPGVGTRNALLALGPRT